MLTHFVYVGISYRDGEGTPKDEDKALKYILLAVDQGYVSAMYEATKIFTFLCIKSKLNFYNAIYYGKKYIKLSETKEFHKGKREDVQKVLARLSSMCRVCGKQGEGYKCCSKCTCVYYCSIECQRKDWKECGHKEKCKKLDF
jgi:TPR repeat protein